MLRYLIFATLPACVLFAAESVSALHQGMGPRHVEASNMHVRILAVVPMIGSGKQGDPIRPAYVPSTHSGERLHARPQRNSRLHGATLR